MDNNGYHILLPVAAVLMLAGVLLMLLQRRYAKRILLGSAMSGIGYGLVPIALTGKLGGGFVYYAMAFAFAYAGAATIAYWITRHGNDGLERFAGLYYRSPRTAAAMGLFLLSLGGLPLTGGFFAMIFIAFQAFAREQAWIGGVMAACSAASYYGYFTFIRSMFMKAGEDDSAAFIPKLPGVVIAVCAAGVLLLGLFPNFVMDLLYRQIG